MTTPMTGAELRQCVQAVLAARGEPPDTVLVRREVSRRLRVHSGLAVATEWTAYSHSLSGERHPLEGHAIGATEADACGALWQKLAPQEGL